MYSELGFELVGKTDPGYFYAKGTERRSRHTAMPHKLKQKPEFQKYYADGATPTEEEVMKAGYESMTLGT